MSQSTFSLTIATVDRILFQGDAASVICPGADGELTVLARHMALVTTLRPGTVRVRTAVGREEFPVERGVLEVSNNQAFVLL